MVMMTDTVTILVYQNFPTSYHNDTLDNLGKIEIQFN